MKWLVAKINGGREYLPYLLLSSTARFRLCIEVGDLEEVNQRFYGVKSIILDVMDYKPHISWTHLYQNIHKTIPETYPLKSINRS